MRSLLLAALLPFAAFAADAIPRIAVVDSKALFDGYKGTKESQDKYDKQVAAWEQEVADKQKELATLKDKFEKQSLMLSEEKKKELQAEFISKQADLQKLAQSLYGKDGRVVQENERFTAPIVQKIRGVVQVVAKAEGYDFVFDKASGAVFYSAKDEYDITPKVLDRLNADYNSMNAPEPPPTTGPGAQATPPSGPGAGTLGAPPTTPGSMVVPNSPTSPTFPKP
jgi:outer membrane protein